MQKDYPGFCNIQIDNERTRGVVNRFSSVHYVVYDNNLLFHRSIATCCIIVAGSPSKCML